MIKIEKEKNWNEEKLGKRKEKLSEKNKNYDDANNTILEKNILKKIWKIIKIMREKKKQQSN